MSFCINFLTRLAFFFNRNNSGTYYFKLKSDLYFYKNKFKIKSQSYPSELIYFIEYKVTDKLEGYIYPIERISLDHKIELEIDDDISLQFLLEIR